MYEIWIYKTYIISTRQIFTYNILDPEARILFKTLYFDQTNERVYFDLKTIWFPKIQGKKEEILSCNFAWTKRREKSYFIDKFFHMNP